MQPNLIHHQFNGLGKEPLERWNFTSILSLGPLRRIHFHFAKYSSLLIQCIHQVGCECQPAADSNGSLVNLFKNVNLLGRVWQPAADSNGSLAPFKLKKACKKQRPVAFDQITHQNCLQNGRRALKAVKILWGQISRPILDLGFFKANECHHKIEEEGYKEIKV